MGSVTFLSLVYLIYLPLSFPHPFYFRTSYPIHASYHGPCWLTLPGWARAGDHCFPVSLWDHQSYYTHQCSGDGGWLLAECPMTGG